MRALTVQQPWAWAAAELITGIREAERRAREREPLLWDGDQA